MAVFFAPGQAPQHVAKNVLKFRAQAQDIDASGTTLLAHLEEGALLKGVFLRRAQDFGGTQSATIRTAGALGTEADTVMVADTDVINEVRNATDYPALADTGGMDVFLDFVQDPVITKQTFTITPTEFNVAARVGSGSFSQFLPILGAGNNLAVGTVIDRLKMTMTTDVLPHAPAGAYQMRTTATLNAAGSAANATIGNWSGGETALAPAPVTIVSLGEQFAGATNLSLGYNIGPVQQDWTSGQVDIELDTLGAPVDDPQEYLQIILYVEAA